MNDKQFARLIKKLGDDDDVDAALEAAKKVEAITDRARLPALYDILETTDNFFVREVVGTAIARLDGLAALRRLLAAMHLDSHDYDGLMTEVSDLIRSRPKESVPILFDMFDYGTRQERIDAVRWMDYVADSITPDRLLRLVESDDRELREAAVGSLGSFKTPEIFELLQHLAVNDANEQVRRSAVGGLMYSGRPEALPTIEAALEDPAEYVRSYARYAWDHLHRPPKP